MREARNSRRAFSVSSMFFCLYSIGSSISTTPFSSCPTDEAELSSSSFGGLVASFRCSGIWYSASSGVSAAALVAELELVVSASSSSWSSGSTSFIRCLMYSSLMPPRSSALDKYACT